MSGRPIPYKQLLALAATARAFDVPVPGVPGQFIVVEPNRTTGRFAVLRETLFGWEYLGPDGWAPLACAAVEDAYRWLLGQALQRAEAAAEEQAAEHRQWQARHAAEAKRARELATVVDEFLVSVRAAVLHVEPVAPAEDGISVPAPADVPGSCFAVPDPAEAQTEELRVVPDTPPGPVDSEAADVNERTQAVDVRVLRDLAGLGDTTQMPAIPDDWPPMPDYPPPVLADALT